MLQGKRFRRARRALADCKGFAMSILTRIFAAIGFIVVMSLITGALVGYWMLSGERSVASLPDRMVLSFDFRRPVQEQAHASPLVFNLAQKSVSLQGLIAALDRARRDDRVVGFRANVGDLELDAAQVEEVRSALRRFRASGKFAYAYADSFGEVGASNRHYWLASAFDQIWLQPLGMLGLTGPAMTVPFAREALDRLGLVADMHQRYEYKGVADTFTRADMPAPLREDYTRLLTDIKTQMVSDIAKSRKMDVAKINHLMDQSPLLAEEALAAKLIDHVGYADEFSAAVAAKAGAGATEVDLMDYAHAVPPLTSKNAAAVPVTALIYVDGPIVRLDDESGPFGESETASAETVVDAIQTAAADSSIKAIVLRVNSPGGSVTASESIHRALMQAKEKGKYIVVSMGGMAASGGYWIATAADRIVASPATLTGSIGVVSGKLVFGPLSERLGVHWAEIGTSQNSGMWSATRRFNPQELARVDASLDQIYAAFIARVSAGRKIPPAKLDELARGRVWTGVRAKEVGLVDALGGLRTGFNLVREHYGVGEDTPLRVMVLPRPETPLELFFKVLQAYIVLPWHLQSALSPEGLWQALLARSGTPPTGELMAPALGVE